MGGLLGGWGWDLSAEEGETNSSSVFILSLGHKSLTAYVSIYQVGNIIFNMFICCCLFVVVYLLFFFFLLANWSPYASLFCLILADMNVIKKKLNKQRKRIVKSAEDHILSKSDTDQFHKFFKLIKEGGAIEGPAKIRVGLTFSAPFSNRIVTGYRWDHTFSKMNVIARVGARGIMVIVVGNGHGGTISNPGRDWLHFT